MTESNWTFLLSVVLTCFALAYARIRYGGFDAFAPGFLLPLTFALCYLGPYFVFMRGVDGFTIYWDLYFSDLDAAVSRALLIYCLIVTGVLFGIVLCRSRGYKATSAAGSVQVVGAKALLAPHYWFIVLGGAVALFMFGVVLVGGLGSLLSGLGDRINLFAGLNYFFIATNVFIAASVVLAVLLLNDRNNPARSSSQLRYLSMLWVAASLTSVCFGVLLGSKANIYVLVISLLVCFHYLVRRFSVVELTVIGFVLFSLLMIYQIVAREIFVVGHVVSLQDGTMAEFIEYSWVQLTGNLMQLQTMSVLADRMPEDLEFQYGKTFASFLTLPVPSTVWPDKFLTAPGVFTLAFWPDKWLDHGTTLPPGLMGEWFLNFGVAGVLFGGVVLGWLYESVYQSFIDPAKPPAQSLIYYAILVAMLLHYIRGEFTAPTLLLLSVVLPVWLVPRLAAVSIKK